MSQIIQWIKKRKAQSAFIFILFFLIITNPSNETGKNYFANSNSINRKYNFFICSIYEISFVSPAFSYRSISGEKEYVPAGGHTENYFAIAGNFFRLPDNTESPIQNDSKKQDTPPQVIF